MLLRRVGEAIEQPSNGRGGGLRDLGYLWIQNMADPRRNSHVGKVFELAEPRFRRKMERNFRIRSMFP